MRVREAYRIETLSWSNDTAKSALFGGLRYCGVRKPSCFHIPQGHAVKLCRRAQNRKCAPSCMMRRAPLPAAGPVMVPAVVSANVVPA
jgi:hypothetical protein